MRRLRGIFMPFKLIRFGATAFMLSAMLAATALLNQAQALTGEWTALSVQGATSWRSSVGEGAWEDLHSNYRVPDSAQIRTSSTGHAVVARGLDRIEVHPESTVVVTARNSGSGTMEIYQDSGSATYTVEKRPAGSFTVRTPYVLAVVKGTQFTVNIENGQTTVSVTEGRVSVSDRRDGSSIDVTPGQAARARAAAPGLDVQGAPSSSVPNGAPAVGSPGRSAKSGLGRPDAVDGVTGKVGSATDALGGPVDGAASGLGDTVNGAASNLTGTVSNVAGDLDGRDSGGGSGGGGSNGGGGDSGGSGTASDDDDSAGGGLGGVGGALGGAVGGALDGVGGGLF